MGHDPWQDEQRTQKPAQADAADLERESSNDSQDKRPGAGYDHPKKSVPQVEFHPWLAKECGEILQPHETVALSGIAEETCADDRVGRVHRKKNCDGHAG